jgi:hypothetical protein
LKISMECKNQFWSHLKNLTKNSTWCTKLSRKK